MKPSLKLLTIPQLQQELLKRNLTIFGKKSILINRIIEFENFCIPYEESDRIFLNGVSADIDKEILLKLSDKDLANVFISNKQSEKICNDDSFWNLRIWRSYESDLSKYKNGKQYKEMYKELIENGYDINEVLIQAATLGYLPVVKYLIERKAYIHTREDAAVRLASLNGHLLVVQYLVGNGADIHSRNDFALMQASANGHLSVVKYLVEKVVDNHEEYSWALVWASKKGQLSVVKYLIEKGANIHVDNDYALILASRKGRLSVVEYLIENGADIHADNDEAISGASFGGHVPVVKYLIQNGANTHAIRVEYFYHSIKSKH